MALPAKALAETAFSFGFTPIPLKGKVPTISEWQNITRENALSIFNSQKANNVGILTGAPSGVVVVDIEAKTFDVWKKAVKEEKFPETFTVLSGGLGIHYYFKYDTSKNLRSSIIKIGGERVGDFLSDGRQAVFAGSITERQYLVLAGYQLKGKTIPEPVIVEMPDFISQIITLSQ